MGNAVMALEIINGLLLAATHYSQLAAQVNGLILNARKEGRDLTDQELDSVAMLSDAATEALKQKLS